MLGESLEECLNESLDEFLKDSQEALGIIPGILEELLELIPGKC